MAIHPLSGRKRHAHKRATWAHAGLRLVVLRRERNMTTMIWRGLTCRVNSGYDPNIAISLGITTAVFVAITDLSVHPNK